MLKRLQKNRCLSWGGFFLNPSPRRPPAALRRIGFCRFRLNFLPLPIRFACPLAELPWGGRGLVALPSRRGLGCVQRSRPAQDPTPASTTATTSLPYFRLAFSLSFFSLTLSHPLTFRLLPLLSFLSPSPSPPFLLAHLDSVHKRLRGVECRTVVCLSVASCLHSSLIHRYSSIICASPRTLQFLSCLGLTCQLDRSTCSAVFCNSFPPVSF